ncbi:ABC transporter ATP-binding protein [Flavobacterium sp. ASW18X]|uniref:ABC transporter ATP-binding protein n=1 Tax=Flavobacterium sp. ASW18X TaxID=2572595 RepID=UPI0010ADED2C|nr:ABC transporter ATP-binding protein [Flavobacterium sp. ASW18X]TKD60696.1 ABC transporter ATP-binding protein [Flavobacterium sp. ASW18X]
MEKYIQVEDLNIGYGKTSIANKLNFSIPKGSLTAIVGINGIGKSTILRTLSGMQPPLSGTISLDGKQIADYTSSTLAQKQALVLTTPIATKNLKVAELIAMGRHPYTNWLGTLGGYDKEIIKQQLHIFSLEDLKDKYCFELSDGQMQRVLIARAMAQETPLVYLDEPTTHLDLSHKVHILKLLHRFAKKHQRTIVFTTHEVELAIQLCDYMLLLDGKENAFAAPCELIEKGSFEYLFPKDLIQFDARTGSFKITK